MALTKERPLAAERASVAGRPPSPRRTTRPQFRITVWLALLPLIAVLGAFAYFPALSSIFWSFFNWVPAGVSTFLGGANYARMMSDGTWWRSFGNLGIIFVFNLASWILPLLAAELLVTLKSDRWQYVIRTLLIIPMAFPGVVTALIWGFFYDPNAGLFNQFLRAIGLKAFEQNWTGSPSTALVALLLVGFPFIAGLPFLIFYSSLQNIPKEVLEAAQLDGVGRWARLWRIDLPLMVSQIRILFFLVVVATLQYGFVAFVLTSGGPDNATMVPVLYIINQAFSAGDWGYAATLSTTLFAITLALSLFSLFIGRRSAGANDGGEM